MELQLFSSILAAIGGLGGLATIISVAYWLGKKFAEINVRFKEINKRFEVMDRRFVQVDKKFEQMDARFEQIDRRFLEFQNQIFRVSRHVHEFIVDVLSYEGVIERKTVELLKSELNRIFSIRLSNPLDEVTRKRILEILAKDEPTLEEAEELYKIASKLVLERGNPEDWKLLTYSRWWIIYHLKKRAEEKNNY